MKMSITDSSARSESGAVGPALAGVADGSQSVRASNSQSPSSDSNTQAASLLCRVCGKLQCVCRQSSFPPSGSHKPGDDKKSEERKSKGDKKPEEERKEGVLQPHHFVEEFTYDVVSIQVVEDDLYVTKAVRVNRRAVVEVASQLAGATLEGIAREASFSQAMAASKRAHQYFTTKEVDILLESQYYAAAIGWQLAARYRIESRLAVVGMFPNYEEEFATAKSWDGPKPWYAFWPAYLIVPTFRKWFKSAKKYSMEAWVYCIAFWMILLSLLIFGGYFLVVGLFYESCLRSPLDWWDIDKTSLFNLCITVWANMLIFPAYLGSYILAGYNNYVLQTIARSSFYAFWVWVGVPDILCHPGWYVPDWVIFILLFVLANLMALVVIKNITNYLDLVSQHYNTKHCSWAGDVPMLHGVLLLYHWEIRCEIVPDLPIKPGRLEGVRNRQRIQHGALALALKCLPVVNDNSGWTAYSGVVRRTFQNPLQADPNALKSFVDFLTTFLVVVLPLPNCVVCQIFSDHAEAETAWDARFPSATRLANARARIIMQSEGADPRGLRCDTFVKKEVKIGDCGVCGEEEVAPRMIATVDRQWHCVLGPLFWCLAKWLCDLWSGGSLMIYASGYNTLSLTPIFVGYACYYVGDVSRFDRSLLPELINVMIAWTLTMPHLTHEQRQGIAAQAVTRAITMVGSHRYAFAGQRRSGDDNTSVHNSILNLAAHMWCVCEHFKVMPGNLATMGFKFVVLGDDIVVCGPREMRDVPFDSYLARLAWKAKPKFVMDLYSVEFCSKFVYPSNLGPVLATPPGRFFARFPFAIDLNVKVDFAEKAYSMLLDCSHVPFVRVYLERILEIAAVKFDRRPEAKDWELTSGLDRVMLAPVPATYVWFMERYGLTERDEQTFREFMGQYQGGPAIATHPFVDIMLEREKLI